MPDIVTDQTSAHDLIYGYAPSGRSLEEIRRMRDEDPATLMREGRAMIPIRRTERGVSRSAPGSRSGAVRSRSRARGAGRLHAVVSINSPRPGEARKAMFAIWAAVNLVKQVAVVDADIDPWDATQVESAIATRMRADEDLIVVPGVRTDRSDPLEQGGVIAKLGIDAARKAANRSDWTKAKPPEAAPRGRGTCLLRYSAPSAR